jgi:hypothetical protein
VKQVGSWFRRKVDHRTVPAELRAIAARENLHAGDSLDSQPASNRTGSCPMIPESLDVRVIQQNSLAFSSRATDGVILPGSINSQHHVPAHTKISHRRHVEHRCGNAGIHRDEFT